MQIIQKMTDDLKPSSTLKNPSSYKTSKDDDDDKKTYVKLISAEGHEFMIQRDIALAANTIRTMLTSSFRESEEKYLHYKVRYSYCSKRIPEFEIKPEKALELLMAASYIDC